MMIRHKMIMMLALAYYVASCGAASARKSEDETRTFGRYRVVRYSFEWNNKFGKVLQIWKGNRKLLERRAHDLWIYSWDKQEQSFELKPTDRIVVRDLTGDGITDVIVQEWNGGAHCCYTFDIYSLGPQLKHIWHHDAGNGHLRVLQPKHGLPELAVENDSDYVTKGTSLTDMPRDIYRWRKGAFRLIRARVLVN